METLLTVAMYIGNKRLGCTMSFADSPMDVKYLYLEKDSEAFRTWTCILFTKDKVVDSFGIDAAFKYSALVEQNQHLDWYLFFAPFSVSLSGEAILSKSTYLEAANGKVMLASDVFSGVIRHMKETLLQMMTDRNVEHLKEETKWVLIGPAIMDCTVERFLRRAAESAGIPRKQLLIVNEEDAAFSCCKYFSTKTLKDMPMDNVHPETSTGSKYLVIYCGDERVAVRGYEIQHDLSFKESYTGCSREGGGRHADEAFKQLLSEVIGAPVLKEYLFRYPSLYLDIFEAFERKKRNLNETQQKIIFHVFTHHAYGLTTEKMNDSIRKTQFSGQIHCNKDRMEIEADVFKDLFKDPLNHILAYLNDVLQIPEIKGTNNIIMAGEFSTCGLLQLQIKKAFPFINLINPVWAPNICLHGAVVYGHENKNDDRHIHVCSRFEKYLAIFRKA